MIKKVILLIVFILLIDFVAAEVIKDVQISILLPDLINTSQEYKELFILKNNDDTVGENDNLSVSLNYSMQKDNNTYLEGFVNKTINYYSKSGMGIVFLEEPGVYLLCASIHGNNYNDSNLDNNNVCKNITAQNETNITQIINETNISIQNSTNVSNCNYSLNLYTKQQVYTKGDSIKFIIYLNNHTGKTFPFGIEYWVEDLFSKIVKKKIFTTSKAEKTYTPSFSERDKSYLIKAKTNCSLETERLVSFRQDIEETQNTWISISSKEEVNTDEILYVDLEGFKANSAKTLISIWVENEHGKISYTTKTYVQIKNTGFKQKLPIIFKDKIKPGNQATIIADGLGETEKHKVTIVYNEEIKDIKKEDITIESFYTRKKKFSPEINVSLRASDKNEGAVEIISSLERKSINFKGNNTIHTSLNISSPNEVITAKLLDKYNNVLDVKYLELELEQEQFTLNTIIKSHPEPEKLNATTITVTSENLITGNTATISKKQSFEPSQIAFFIGSIIVAALLFRKESRNFFKSKYRNLKENTKLFK